MATCKVAKCRHPNTHTVAGHKCGTCGKYGHGQIECNNLDKITALQKYKNDKINTPCISNGCNHRHLHTSEAHLCYKCNRFHPIQFCIIQNFVETQEKYSDFLSNINPAHIFGSQNNTFFPIRIGMGCEVYTRNKNNSIQCLFMHSDCWGQYGPKSDDTPILDKFIEGLTEINYTPFEQTTEKKCPLCRTKINKVVNIKGSNDTCSVCIDKKVELFFPDCAHAATCKKCYDKL